MIRPPPIAPLRRRCCSLCAPLPDADMMLLLMRRAMRLYAALLFDVYAADIFVYAYAGLLILMPMIILRLSNSQRLINISSSDRYFLFDTLSDTISFHCITSYYFHYFTDDNTPGY